MQTLRPTLTRASILAASGHWAVRRDAALR